MDWLRSEDLKEEKKVTAPNVYYSSPAALSLPNLAAYHWDMYGMNSQCVAADSSDPALLAGILLREEPEDEEDDEENGKDEEDDGDGDEGYSE